MLIAAKLSSLLFYVWCFPLVPSKFFYSCFKNNGCSLINCFRPVCQLTILCSKGKKLNSDEIMLFYTCMMWEDYTICLFFFCNKWLIMSNTFLGNKNHNITSWSSKVDFIWQLLSHVSVQTKKILRQMFIVKNEILLFWACAYKSRISAATL